MPLIVMDISGKDGICFLTGFGIFNSLRLGEKLRFLVIVTVSILIICVGEWGRIGGEGGGGQ